MEQDKIDKLKKIGGKEWKNYGCHRIYFNNLTRLLKLERNSLNGELIGKHMSEAVADVCSRAKFWYDVEKDKFHSQNFIVKDFYMSKDGLLQNLNLKEMLIDIIDELISDNEFTSILSDLDDI